MVSNPSPTQPAIDLADLERRLQQLQVQLSDLQEFDRLEKLPPERAAEMLEQILDLETRMQTYVEGLVSFPAIFWQAVRWGGLGVLVGVLLQRIAG
ncbi:hypothetical protein [Synechococcus sp. PCC 7336]|uniref:hypothetical protein n=1 Tax=Synechococcus sp. PCC 7336 TaxID=195250 RepID=UPI00034DF0BC|nr:hypothetical protein [Synechococcus sp. PCC 7336]